jgi:hypothetical protein
MLDKRCKNHNRRFTGTASAVFNWLTRHYLQETLMPITPVSSTPTSPGNPREALVDRVQRAVNDVSYPAHPGTLIDAATQEHADPEVLEALRRLPDEAFGSFPEVSASIVAALDARALPRREVPG